MLLQTIITYDTWNDFLKALPANIREETKTYLLYLYHQTPNPYGCFDKLPAFLTLYYMPKNHIKEEEGIISTTSDIFVLYNDNNILKQVAVGTQQGQESSKEKVIEALTEVAVGAVKEVKKRIQEEKLREEALEFWGDYMKKHC